MPVKTFYMNPFYDAVFGFFDINVPSKRIRWKQNEKGEIIKLYTSNSVKDFEIFVKESLINDREPNWPLSGDLFVAITIELKESEYNSKDIDNITKTILDSIKGSVIKDDKQICSIFVRKDIKRVMPGFFVALKKIDRDTFNDITIPSFFSDQPYV